MEKSTLVKLFFVIAIVGITICTLISMDNKDEAKTLYNNGVHAECGGEWKVTPIGRKMNTSYVYMCDKCNEVFETTCPPNALKNN